MKAAVPSEAAPTESRRTMACRPAPVRAMADGDGDGVGDAGVDDE
jgi:hypothetical protein